ncbi:DUF4198 domain-containing protein [Glaciecola sp. 1036]|uniref:DUF4198 domain-containing protein n=1 Tax=Alteromonadaceae TaxID=72275 RepID=UPI003D00C0BC
MTVHPIFKLAAGILLSAVVVSASAHRAWIKPSETVLSGDQNYVTFDAAVSNTLFLPEHVPLRTNGILVTGPTATKVELENVATGKYRSTFDINLQQQGTYKIASASSGLRAFWKDAEGNRKMWPPRGRGAGEQTFEQAVPKDAKELQVSYSSRRVETYVSLGAPDETALAITKTGLELKPLTHPNDLFATETASFQFLMDGEPVEGVEIEIVRGSMRYRNDSETITLTSDADGKFSVTWPTAGMYFIEASYSDEKAKAPATRRQGGYALTLEVLPL